MKKTEHITDCINMAGNAGHKIEYRRAKQELEILERSNKALLEASKLLLIAIKKQELTIFPANENTTDYLQIVENAVKEADNFNALIL